MDRGDLFRLLKDDIESSTLEDFSDARWIDDLDIRYEIVHELVDRLVALRTLGSGDLGRIMEIHYEVVEEGSRGYDMYLYMVDLLTQEV